MATRQRGAQPGNTNALKHGLYSARLDPDQLSALHHAREHDPDDLAEEVALIRARLAVLLDREDGITWTPQVIYAARTIAHLAAIHHRLQPAQADDLASSITRVVEGLAPTLGLGESFFEPDPAPPAPA